MKFKTIIVEDEIHSLERLKSLLENFEKIEIIGEAQDGETAVKLINATKPDLIFLDIELPEYNGFEVLEKLEKKPNVIFVTSYNEYAIKAFEENAIDYILKPTSKERLKKSINRIKEDDSESTNNLLQLLNTKIFPEYINRFSVKTGDEILIIPDDKIFYFKAENKYIFLGTFEKEFFYESTLKELELILDHKKFIRVSKSHIVSLDKIKKFSKWFLGDYNLKLLDKKKTTIKVGRKYLPKIRKIFKF